MIALGQKSKDALVSQASFIHLFKKDGISESLTEKVKELIVKMT